MSHPTSFEAEARAGLVRHFGLSEFRPGQLQVITTVMSGRNGVVVMPTGAGKSLCYQLPASLLPGLTLVVSPLISLMKDQVEQLEAKGISAAYLNSTLSEVERAERFRKLRARQYKLLYVAPERFRSASFLELVAEVGVELFAVDEAHCISQWGHDFRPDYAQLGQVRKKLRPPRTVALTATATPEVRQDIVKSLLMKDPQVFVAGFDRPNLFLEVTAISGDDERREATSEIAREGGSGIVYCSTRKSAEMMHQALSTRGHHALLYHAGMDDSARDKAQEQFMADPNAIAVATNAFGMGIDKPDVRFVVHAQIPRAVEAYYQEIGRGARDGGSGRAVLLFNHADVHTQTRLIESSHPAEAVFADVWNALVEVETYDRGVGLLAAQTGSSEFEVSAALRIFERAGKLSRTDRGEGSYGLTLTPRAPEAHPHSEDARALLATLLAAYPLNRPFSTDLGSLNQRTQLGEKRVRHALTLLEKAGVVKVRRPFAGRAISLNERVPFHQLGLDLRALREQERRAQLLLKRMTEYAYARRCRRAFLLRYFGEADLAPSCGNCEVCCGPRLVIPQVSRTAPPAASLSAVERYSELAFEQLRGWRKHLAADLGVPPYVIFPDLTLKVIAAALPLDKASFLGLKGTGEASWERFGAKILEICKLARAAGDVPVAFHGKPPRKRRRSEARG